MKKRCSGCGEIKSVKGFSKNKGSQDGYDNWCKTCRKTYKQSTKGKESTRRYNRSEKGKQAEKRRAQTEKRKQYNKHFWQSDKGKQANKKTKASRRTNETQAGGSYTADQWFSLCKFYDFRCLRCNKKLPFEKLTLDHVKPVSKGGSSDIWNTQPLCKICNSSKGNKEIDYRKKLPDWINRDGPVWQQDRLF